MCVRGTNQNNNGEQHSDPETIHKGKCMLVLPGCASIMNNTKDQLDGVLHSYWVNFLQALSSSLIQHLTAAAAAGAR